MTKCKGLAQCQCLQQHRRRFDDQDDLPQPHAHKQNAVWIKKKKRKPPNHNSSSFSKSTREDEEFVRDEDS